MRNFFRGLITTHKNHASHLRAVAPEKIGDQVFVQDLTRIFPQMRTMASLAMTRTPGEVERKRHLSGNLLKYNVV